MKRETLMEKKHESAGNAEARSLEPLTAEAGEEKHEGGWLGVLAQLVAPLPSIFARLVGTQVLSLADRTPDCFALRWASRGAVSCAFEQPDEEKFASRWLASIASTT